MGVRELDLVTQYTVHPYDPVPGLYFAQARMYDAADRRFIAVDPVIGRFIRTQPMSGYGYVANNPIKYIDPLGLFLIGTILTEGASGDDVLAINHFLHENGFIEDYNYEYMVNYMDIRTYNHITAEAVIKYQESMGLYTKGSGNVGSLTWTSMGPGFELNTTLEEEFWSGERGNDTISVSISGNAITIDYRPKIYMDEYVDKLFAR